VGCNRDWWHRDQALNWNTERERHRFSGSGACPPTQPLESTQCFARESSALAKLLDADVGG